MAVPASLPALLFVHGAWHNSKSWDSLRSALEKHGYETHAVDLPSVGLRENPPKDHLEDVETIRIVLNKLIVHEGKNVLLVPHSYGGIPSSCAVEGFEPGRNGRSNGVIAVVFIDACVATEGLSSAEMCANAGGGIPKEHRKMLNDSYSEVVDPYTAFYHDATREEAQVFINELQPHAVASMTSKVSYEAWKYVPVVFVHCTKSVALPIETQRNMLEAVRRSSKYPVTLHEIPASHTPMLKFEKELVGFIRAAAGIRSERL